VSRSLFTVLFDHMDSCPGCEVSGRKLCDAGKLLFKAAVRTASEIAGNVRPEPKGSA
jgi:hypothetical protein